MLQTTCYINSDLQWICSTGLTGYGIMAAFAVVALLLLVIACVTVPKAPPNA